MTGVLLPAVLAGAVVALPALPSESRTRLAALRGHAVRDGHRVAMVVGAVLAAVLLGPAPAGVLAAAALGVRRLVRTRRAAGADELERRRVLESCQALAAELRAGQPAPDALQEAAALAVGSSAQALAAAASTARLGGEVSASLRGARDAPAADVLAGLAVCWDLCAQSGSGLAAAVDRVADAARARADQQRAVAAALAEPRATATLLAGLPLAGVALGAALGGSGRGPLGHVAPDTGRAGLPRHRHGSRRHRPLVDAADLPPGAARVTAWVVGLLCGLAVLVTGLRAPSRLIGRRAPRPEPPPRAALLDLARSPPVACGLASLAALLLVGGRAGLGLGLLVALGGPGVVAGLEPAAVRVQRERLSADLPSALDLLAACLAGGAAPGAAAAAVAQAVDGPLGQRLTEVAARLEVGSAPPYAWAALAGDGLDEDAASAARTLARASDGGAPVAAAVARLAAQARVRARSRGERAAARASVLGVAPLGLCFLPAFVLIGIVPVVVGLIGPALHGV